MSEFRMPSLGADMEAGTLAEWLVKPGDHVKRGDIIATVDTQKGLIDIEVFEEGTIEKLVIRENEKVPVGTVMALIADGKPPAHIRASPLAKRLAKEKGIDLASVKGSGEGGAITQADIEKLAPLPASALLPVSAPAAAPTPKDSIRQAVAAAMSRSKKEIPHYYLQNKVDMTAALSWLTDTNSRRSVKQRLLPAVLLIKAVALALKEVPELNGYWENGLVRKEEINIGFVVSLRTGGVMIPAVRQADKKTLDELMEALNDIIPRARSFKLRSSELSESTFTITSLGEGSAETVFGVIYPPQLGIAGFGNIAEQPWAENGMLDVRKVMTVTLSADHRATDGIIGSRFLIAVNNHLLHPDKL